VTDLVASIRAETVVLPLPAPLRLGAMTIEAREYATVRVETESGLTGKAYCLTRNAPVAAMVDRLVAPYVVGGEAGAIRELWDGCIRANVTVARTGLARRALGLVDVALWDLAAQRAREPLFRRLGAEPPAVPVILVAAYPVADASPEELADAVLAYARQGYRLLKVARSADSAFMRRWLQLVEAKLPASARLIVDVAYAWPDADTALRECAEWGTEELAWLEDPLVPEDVEGLTRLRREGPYPIAVGDELAEPLTVELLLAAEAVDVLRVDTVALGGVTPVLEVLDRAAAAGTPVSFHIFPELNVHLAALTPRATVEMFDPDLPGGNPLDPWHLLSSGRLRVEDGVAAPPDGAGIGFDLLEVAA
jgi:L-alanine-DL-glutamate epimerase-like enolase superfamily enzyme